MYTHTHFLPCFSRQNCHPGESRDPVANNGTIHERYPIPLGVASRGPGLRRDDKLVIIKGKCGNACARECGRSILPHYSDLDYLGK